MVRALLLIALIACAAFAVAAFAFLRTPADRKVSLKSVSVDLPNSDRMFPSMPGSDVANNNCLSCHSAGMVLNQPAMAKAKWEAEVNKMRVAYKAPINPADVGPIADYLAGIRGTK